MASLSAIPERFGKRVKMLRKDRGLTQERLAELAGLHFTYISGIERGLRNVSLTNIVRLARALKVTTAAMVQDL